MANQTVAAVFDRYSDAANAVSQLEAAGVQHSNVSIVSNDQTERGRYGDAATRAAADPATGAGTGATVGTVVGGGAGLLAGLGLMAIPGLGPVVAAGWLVATLVGAGAGAAAGGLLGSLTGAGISEADSHTYAEAVHRGGTLVTVRATDVDHDRVVSILESAGAVDLDDRASNWRSEGWNGQYAGGADAQPGGGLASSAGAELGVTNPVADPYPTGTAPGTTTTAAGRPRVRSYPQT